MRVDMTERCVVNFEATMMLRFVVKDGSRTLQQAWISQFGDIEWHDIEEVCEHDKKLNEYCEPCGRINNA